MDKEGLLKLAQREEDYVAIWDSHDARLAEWHRGRRDAFLDLAGVPSGGGCGRADATAKVSARETE